MVAILPLLEVSGRGQADLVIVATVLFLVFATCGFIVASLGQPSVGSSLPAQREQALAARTPKSSLRAAIIAGLLCGLVALAISGC